MKTVKSHEVTRSNLTHGENVKRGQKPTVSIAGEIFGYQQLATCQSREAKGNFDKMLDTSAAK